MQNITQILASFMLTVTAEAVAVVAVLAIIITTSSNAYNVRLNERVHVEPAIYSADS